MQTIKELFSSFRMHVSLKDIIHLFIYKGLFVKIALMGVL